MARRIDWNEPPQTKRKPDFENLLAVLRREQPARPTLWDFGTNGQIRQRGYGALGADYGAWPYYDYEKGNCGKLEFKTGARKVDGARTASLNRGSVITDRASFEAFDWPDPDKLTTASLDAQAARLAPGAKIIAQGGGDGVLETTIRLVGFDNLCYMLVDDEALVADIFHEVGWRRTRAYELAAPHPAVGAASLNDDWGFKSQTMLSPADLRRFVFPWYKKITAIYHSYGKPVILHSCGYFANIIDDITDLMRIDARHSYEDNILPVEEAYEAYHARLAIIGGIDMDFMARAEPEQIYKRSCDMLERSATRGGYALGTGNSVPDYIPEANYFAMVRAALDVGGE